MSSKNTGVRMMIEIPGSGSKFTLATVGENKGLVIELPGGRKAEYSDEETIGVINGMKSLIDILETVEARLI